jgi:hypothetical protein
MSEIQYSATTQLPIQSSKESLDFLLAEYAALRAEILKRTETQHQLISLALIATGTFLTTGSATATLAYPILAMFLVAAWVQSDLQIGRMGEYIRKRIEERFLGGNLGWEHVFVAIHDVSIFGSLAHFASRGVFIGTQILTMVVSLLKTSFPIEDVVLLVLDSLAIIFTLLLFRRHKLNLVL